MGKNRWIDEKYMDGQMDRKKQNDGWMDINNRWITNIWMVGWKKNKNMKKIDRWLDGGI